jgi:two-component system CheB/CheR fusion protein
LGDKTGEMEECMTDSSHPDFEALLDYVKHSRGFDFTGYKRSSLMRRVTRRMQVIGMDDYRQYLDYLQVHPEEFNSLFNTLLINVTAFFRDRLAWDYVGSEIIPRIVANKVMGEPIRVWSAGCASGEEAYTVAMLIAEAIGIEQFRQQVKIYATDLDEEALTQARQATYTSRELAGVLPHQLELFFEPYDERYTFRSDLRQSVIFGRHDLIQDAPISRIDLLVCRNVLMYFNAETQRRIFDRFHFALHDDGFMFLGKAEMLLSHAKLFTPIDLKRRIFTKVAKSNWREQPMLVPQSNSEEPSNYRSNLARLREVVFDSSPTARIVIDINGFLTMADQRSRSLFNLTARDLGRPLQDLELSYRPIELRSRIEQVYGERQMALYQDVEWQIAGGEAIYLDVQIVPLIDETKMLLGVSINFIDVTHYRRLQERLQASNQELEMAYEELQSSNEELETTNEELQSSNEELETANEELQSTNEELETMNEELHSTNEELQTVNEELQQRTEELNQTNAFLESILTSLKGGVVVIDRNLRVQIWNYKAEDLWGVRAEEALGQHFLNLDIGLPTEQLRQPLRQCFANELDGSLEVILDAINRRGRSMKCRVTCTPLLGANGQTEAVILLMEAMEG